MQTLYIDNKLEGAGGQQDYTRNLMEANQFYSHENNLPCLFNFQLQDLGDENFVIPTRGSYVTFEDSRFESRDEGVPDGILFTGYVSDEPEPIWLGMNQGVSKWAYKIQATSEDYLPQMHQLPPKIYVNKTRGYIIRDIVRSMFANANTQPLDVAGVRDGGIERLYQTDSTKKFSDMMTDFAKADAYRYRVLDGKLFYGPEVELLPGSSDPEQKLVIDEQDPRFTPANLALQRVATTIVNDVTVYGLEEPTTLVSERYVSDGYQGEHRLLFKPYGVLEKILIEDDFSSPEFDTSLWQEEDNPLAVTGVGDGSYLQMFEGALNIVGGSGGQETPAVWLRSRRGIELSGIIEFRDCELYFAPGSTGFGLVGGLFSDESMKLSSCFAGWHVNMSALILTPIINGSVQVINGGLVYANILADGNHHYILRRRFEFDIPTGLPTTHRGPHDTNIVFGDGVVRVNGCRVTYIVESIDITNPQAVVTTKTEIFSSRLENVPEFVLYAPIVSYDLHAVMNFCKVKRPQQVRVEIDSVPIPLGDFMDGGLGMIEVNEDASYLKWYSVPTSIPDPAVPSVPTSGTPLALWKLGDSGDFISDSSSGAYPMQVAGPVSLTPGAPSASIDQARSFPGATGPSSGLPFGPNIFGPVPGNPFFADASTGCFPVPFSITGWLKTSSSDGPLFVFSGAASGYVGIWIQNGRISCRLSVPESSISGTSTVNDGAWHHFAVVHDAAPSAVGTTSIYVDGVMESSGAQQLITPGSPTGWFLGYDNVYWSSLNTYIQTWYTGALDEIALWTDALTIAEIDSVYKSTQGVGTAAPAPAYNPQTGVTIPPQGAKVDITYYRAQQSRARVKSTESILRERARFGDDGIRQYTILADDVNPSPRTSEECQYLAQAFLLDRASHRYEGTYTFETGENDETRLNVMTAPGDLVPCELELPNGEIIDANLHCTAVDVAFAAKGLYQVALGFGPINRFDEAQRKLLVSRKSSLDNPEITDRDTLVAEIISSVGYVVPTDPKDLLISNVTPLTFTVNMNPTRLASVGGYGAGGGTEINGDLPDGVIGYEIRRGDSGWGQINYVAKVTSATFALNRGTRDKAYFIRPYNAQNVYSRNSALVRVISPLSNTLVASNLDGDVGPEFIRLYIPIDKNPDVGGWLVQKTNSDGVVLYQGNGIDHRTIVSGATILIESGRVSLSMPISTGATTVRVLVYNILGEFGPETLFTITRVAPIV
jgi:hypothetical protein